MKIELRDYQESLINKTFAHWAKEDRRVLLQSATGSGKTVMLAAIAKTIVERGGRVLTVSHTTELVVQAATKKSAIAGYPCGIIKAGFDLEPEYLLQSGSVQSLRRRLDKVGEFDLIIVDECHRSVSSGYQKIFERWPEALVLGCSATPRRLDKKSFEGLYDVMLCGPSMANLIESGYLSSFKLYAAETPMVTDRVRTLAGDFSQKELAEANDAVTLSGDLIESYQKHAYGKRCLVFCINVEHSQQAAASYNAVGIPAIHLDGTTPAKERRRRARGFCGGLRKSP